MQLLSTPGIAKRRSCCLKRWWIIKTGEWLGVVERNGLFYSVYSWCGKDYIDTTEHEGD